MGRIEDLIGLSIILGVLFDLVILPSSLSGLGLLSSLAIIIGLIILAKKSKTRRINK